MNKSSWSADLANLGFPAVPFFNFSGGKLIESVRTENLKVVPTKSYCFHLLLVAITQRAYDDTLPPVYVVRF